MTTLTDEQARELAQEVIHMVCKGLCGLHSREAHMARYILLSRPSSGVQPISGASDNAGQSEGAAHAAPIPGEKP